MRVDDHRLDGSAPSARAVPTLGTVEKVRGARGGALELELWAPASRAVSRARSAVQRGHHRSPSASVPAANAGGAVGGTSVALLVCARARGFQCDVTGGSRGAIRRWPPGELEAPVSKNECILHAPIRVARSKRFLARLLVAVDCPEHRGFYTGVSSGGP